MSFSCHGNQTHLAYSHIPGALLDYCTTPCERFTGRVRVRVSISIRVTFKVGTGLVFGLRYVIAFRRCDGVYHNHLTGIPRLLSVEKSSFIVHKSLFLSSPTGPAISAFRHFEEYQYMQSKYIFLFSCYRKR